MDLNKIGKFIAEERKKKSLTQEQLAEKLGINSRTISRWENGKNMPDVSLYKDICEELGISIEELINGEKTNRDNIKISYEKALITTVDKNSEQKREISKLFKILLFVIIFSVLTILLIIIYYDKKYPKIDVYSMKIIESDNNILNDDLTFKYDDFNVYFYGVDSLQLGNINNLYYDLKTALRYRQVNIDKIKKYLNNQYESGDIDKVNYNNVDIYKHKDFEIIVCNTKDNKDIYVGTPNIATNLKGNYCGKQVNNHCSFIRTYTVIKYQNTHDYNYIDLTLKQYQMDTELVRIKRNDIIKEGKTYEFEFVTYEKYEDTIKNIFKNSELIGIKETSKKGMDQIMDVICIN